MSMSPFAQTGVGWIGRSRSTCRSFPTCFLATVLSASLPAFCITDSFWPRVVFARSRPVADYLASEKRTFHDLRRAIWLPPPPSPPALVGNAADA